ncbi:MAG: zinc-dependent alcohol dehydrogenase [Bacillota bacterium]
MKAIQMAAPKQLELVNTEKPAIAADEVLIKVAYGGICGSDIHIYHGNNERVKYPLIACHEFSGEIVEIGKECSSQWEIGDKVVVNPLISCGVCDPCVRGNVHVCKKLGLIGIDIDGAFAEYVKAKPYQLIKVPEGIPLDTAALAEPLAVGIHAVTTSGLKIGDKVVILGGGPIGLMVAFAAKAAGAGLVVISEVSQFRLEMAKEMGFEVINAADDVKQKVLELTDGVGADIVFEAAAAPATSAQMTGLLRISGTAVMVGVHRDLAGVNLREVNLRELKIIGARVYTQNNFVTAVKLLPELKELSKVITHRLSFEEHAKAFAAMMDARDSLKILLHP